MSRRDEKTKQIVYQFANSKISFDATVQTESVVVKTYGSENKDQKGSDTSQLLDQSVEISTHSFIQPRKVFVERQELAVDNNVQTKMPGKTVKTDTADLFEARNTAVQTLPPTRT